MQYIWRKQSGWFGFHCIVAWYGKYALLPWKWPNFGQYTRSLSNMPQFHSSILSYVSICAQNALLIYVLYKCTKPAADFFHISKNKTENINNFLSHHQFQLQLQWPPPPPPLLLLLPLLLLPKNCSQGSTRKTSELSLLRNTSFRWSTLRRSSIPRSSSAKRERPMGERYLQCGRIPLNKFLSSSCSKESKVTVFLDFKVSKHFNHPSWCKILSIRSKTCFQDRWQCSTNVCHLRTLVFWQILAV